MSGLTAVGGTSEAPSGGEYQFAHSFRYMLTEVYTRKRVADSVIWVAARRYDRIWSHPRWFTDWFRSTEYHVGYPGVVAGQATTTISEGDAISIAKFWAGAEGTMYQELVISVSGKTLQATVDAEVIDVEHRTNVQLDQPPQTIVLTQPALGSQQWSAAKPVSAARPRSRNLFGFARHGRGY